MEKIDLVVVGAEGVVESGGIINKVGAKNILQLSYIPNVHISYTIKSCLYLNQWLKSYVLYPLTDVYKLFVL